MAILDYRGSDDAAADKRGTHENGPAIAPSRGIRARSCRGSSWRSTKTGFIAGEHVMRTPDARLAVLLREVQWELDEVAFDLPAGRCSPERRAHLADALIELAEVVRQCSPQVINTEPSQPARALHGPS
jgi:hypothetical protein